ncbi:MAG: HAD-IIIA family hydrolase [Candidatus Omnitrophica bacterium]|nr:HAD-IIIA family hydrolase [Candidatus Omnitrophota bacterium]
MEHALRRIKVLAMDVDGVLTDGRIITDANGVETKNFDVQDGSGIVFIRKAGIKTAVISARLSGVVKYRVEDLQIDKAFIGAYPKTAAYEQMLKEFGVRDEDVCFIGDDLADLVILKRAGFAAAPANAVFEIKQAADYVSRRRGGEGAVREVVELVLKAQGKWGPELYEH